ncbi:MAG: helix-turn-helix domain-containing protein [Treponema sp.]|jgi:excisionase family DNA binding protein|nr:helix-turn-helix domain-containing protein [Treponema sp.]
MNENENEKENMELLSVEEAAAYLKFSTTYLYRLAREKKIPHVSYGRHIIFRKADLYNWLGSMVCPVLN